MSGWAVRLAAVLLAAAAATGARAQNPLEEWSVYGSNTARIEHYDNGGEPGFFPFEGYQAYEELTLGFARRPSPFEHVQGDLLGLANGSDYRSNDTGLVLERGSVTWEKGDTTLPFRATGGDFFGFLSRRSLQRPLKGLHTEFQPALIGPLTHSVVLFSGTDKTVYRDFDPTDDLYSGASWLIEGDPGDRFALNFVHNLRDGDGLRDLGHHDQSVFSAAGEQAFELAGQRLNLEGELAWLTGDVERDGAVVGGRSESGYFAQLRGENRGPLSYRLRYEHYGRDFRPSGGAIVPDRRSYEAHAAWRFDSGLRLRGRWQRFRDDFETANPLDTQTAGISLGGPLAGGISSALDAFVQSRERRDGSVDALTRAVNLNLAAALSGGWNARLGAFFQSTDDTGSDNDRVTRQLSVGADRRVRFGGYEGFVSPGLVLRTVRGGSASADEYGPTLAAELRRERHAMNLDYSLLNRDRHGGDDVLDQRLALRYTYTRRNHEAGLEVDYLGRDPDAADTVHGNRIGLFYTYHFDRPAAPVRTPTALAATPLIAAGDGRLDLTRLTPGADLDQARALVKSAGFGDGIVSPDRVVYEAQILDAVEQRQRLVLVGSAGRLERAVLIIDFIDPTDSGDAIATFERTRSVLIERYGRPDASYERGEFGEDLARAVNTQAAVRVDEWVTRGGRLRFGIPRRLDGQVRMELHHAYRFPSLRDALWGLEAVR